MSEPEPDERELEALLKLKLPMRLGLLLSYLEPYRSAAGTVVLGLDESGEPDGTIELELR